MDSRRRLSTAVGLAALAAAALASLPARYAVEGCSMAPGLVPGDVVATGAFPWLDRLRRPRRFERWVVDLADGAGIKRVAGLPGEEIAIVAGDLEIDGAIVAKGPRLLGDMGSVVPDDVVHAPGGEPGWAWSRPAGEILDDASFAAGVTHVLTAVPDVGLTAVVDVRAASAQVPAEVRVRVGDTVVVRPLASAGRHAVVAGRLDGRLVVAAWPVAADAAPTSGRSCLPPGPPDSWDVTESWPMSGGADEAPALAIGGECAIVTSVSRWRDVAWRPGADGRSSWRLGTDEAFVLGDFPASSTDSRHWGPLPTRSLQHRIASD